MSYEVICQDIIEWSKSYAGPKFHAVLSDPPYGLKFMGKDWDVMSACEWGKAMLPHLHPGAIVLMFGGTRTWHKLATGMEEAGFQIWDTLMWLYGTGFPKGQDISKLIDKANGSERERLYQEKRTGKETGTLGAYTGNNWVTAPGSEVSVSWSGHKTCALKPAWEPILAFRAPGNGKTYADLALECGSGCLNIDETRIGTDTTITRRNGNSFHFYEGGRRDERVGQWENPPGRYPANLVLDEKSAALLDEQQPSADGASRFFYVAKAANKEKNAGVEKNTHPTIKPLTLTKWLATLLLPPDSVKPRRLLVPFAGSGSEMIGALQAGWDEVTGVEREAEYCETAKARLNHWTHKGD